MHHLFLSPHFDDAVYSCGGTIANLTRAGEGVTALTICAGHPPVNEISYFAETLHERWGYKNHAAASQMVDIRRQEDETALSIVGADGLYLDIPDCIYRRGGERNRWFYPREEALFARLNGAEDALISNIARSIIEIADALSNNPNQIKIYAPLSLGNHVDHQLVRYAAERAFGSETITYYQDYPYAQQRDQIITYESSADWRSKTTYLSENDIERKVQAVAAYKTQLSTFWESERDMEQAVREFLRGWGNGELFWRFTPRLFL